MRAHAGQVSFPGGAVEEQDGGDLFQTARRETEEEIGLTDSKTSASNQIILLAKYHEILSSSNIGGKYDDLRIGCSLIE